MRELQADIIKELGVKPSIDPTTEISARVGFLKDYLKTSGAKGFVLGISGGVDSTLVGKLAQLAAQELRAEGIEAVFVAVKLPHGVQKDAADAQAAIDFIAPDEDYTVNIADPVMAVDKAVAESGYQQLSDFNRGNVKARMRMIMQYALAGDRHLLVLGTDHGAEAVTGFYTKYGDGGVDIVPLEGLNKRQNQSLLRELEAPEKLWAKVPTADLLDNQPQRTDEDELGLRYEQIDDYLEGKDIGAEASELIERRFMASRHKRAMPAAPADSWWRR